ncbi:3-demethylubiquinone-9 3-methyltransferase [Penicillium brasilianum]|uniref:Ubiquinone biosynthesis O-methyltransferase, mitochondrial n=1 Tax=Penicillium brasilianum TaxID=104259 RepID=A0A1S9RXB3_PENBI|nr:3-demethylubiquinone-9 3-methyltransferase [Penicillium brasilianum]
MASIRPRPNSLRALQAASTAARPTYRHFTSRFPSSSPLSRKAPITRNHSTSSVSPDELSHFSALASSWWDPMGPSRILHLMNPLRHEFIASCLADSPPPTTTDTASASSSTAANLHYMDIGCGGGIFAESLARTIPLDPSAPAPTATRAASMTAIDPSTMLIQVARDHARMDPTVDAHLRSGKFKYLNTTLEDVLASGSPSGSPPSGSTTGEITHPQFDMVTLFEVIEHIDPTTTTPQAFLSNCLRALKPGGWLIGSTISRTFPSFLLNQVIAEAPWPIGVVPRGTHEWSKFVNPPELHAWAQEGLMRAADTATSRGGPSALEGMDWKCMGTIYVPGLGWKLVPGSESWGNYFWAVKKGV